MTEVRVDDAFYEKCIDKLIKAMTDVVFADDTQLEKVLIKDILVVLGGYIVVLGKGIMYSFSSDDIDEDNYMTQIWKNVIDTEELWQNLSFGEMVSTAGAFLEIAGREIMTPDIGDEEDSETS